MSVRALGAIAVGMVGLWSHGCTTSEFTCEADPQCVSEGAGVCQPDGHCSFPAADCPSGQRYGEHSGPQSGQCVGEGGSSGADPGEGSSSIAPPVSSSGPVLDTGLASEGEATTSTIEPATSGPLGSTSDGTTEGGASSGEPVDPDLVLWLELERAPAGQVPDSSSYMGDGTCDDATCPSAVPGIVGVGAALDGQDDAVLVPHAPWLETMDGFTIAAWVRIGAPSVSHQAVLTKPVGRGIGNSWELYFADELFFVGMQSNGQYYNVTLPWTIEPDQWVHVAGTWDGSTLTLWIDGQNMGSTESPAIEFDDHPVVVGADDDHLGGLSGFLLGAVDDVRVYRRALSSEELGALVASARAGA